MDDARIRLSVESEILDYIARPKPWAHSSDWIRLVDSRFGWRADGVGFLRRHPGGEAALFQVPLEVTGDADALVNAVDRIREVTAESGGLTIKTTGPAGFSADAISVFGDINTTLLLATGTLVIVLLLIIYRSPVFWLLPVIAIAFAETTLRAVGYLLGSNGVVINGQTQGITLVLVFGGVAAFGASFVVGGVERAAAAAAVPAPVPAPAPATQVVRQRPARGAATGVVPAVSPAATRASNASRETKT